MSTEWDQLRRTLMTPNTILFERLANLRELMSELEDSLNAVSSSTTTAMSCPTCRESVPRIGYRNRQSCPSCGSAYNSMDERLFPHRNGRNHSIELPQIVFPTRSRLGSFGQCVFGHFRSLYPRRENTSDGAYFTYEPGETTGTVDGLESVSPSPTCLGRRRHPRKSQQGSLVPLSANYCPNDYRIGSGNSLPPIQKDQIDKSRRSSVNIPHFRVSKSEERIPKSLSDSFDRADVASATKRPIYPLRNVKRHEFMKRVKKAKDTKNYNEMKTFYFETFESFESICATFKRDPNYSGAKVEETGLKTELVHVVYDLLRGMPSSVQKQYLRAVINSLLEDRPLLHSKDRLRALFVLIQCPVFLSQSSYNVLAHVIRATTNLPNIDHQLLVSWLKTLEVSRFRLIVSFITQFITVRQFPPPDRSLPPLSSSKWWIPCATKVLAILYASNLAATPPLVPYTEFYNHALDHLDLMTEYRRWQIPERSEVFSYCQYPFVLSIVAKRFILTKDAEQQMILTARRSLVARVAQHRPPQLDIFFLNIHVRRSNLVEDSLKEIEEKKNDLKKKLRVTFEGEPGLDMGGLTKEWFLLLTKRIFMPENKMFVYHPSKRLHWFTVGSEGSLREYNLIGVLMGLAVYNSIILDVKFPSICYRKLLEPPVVPSNEVIPVGIAKEPSLNDLAEIMPEVAHSLKELLKYEGNVEEDMGLTFEVSLEEYGIASTFNLKENGETEPVTSDNREEFVRLYLDWILNTAIYEQFRAFYVGFHSVTASNALIMLRPEEVEMLVCGSPTLDLGQLRKVTEYDGYSSDHPTIRCLWEVLQEIPLEKQKQFLLFSTGSDRIPVGGMAEMSFKISLWEGQTQMLPQAHTCFNQLVLPPYPDKESLRDKLMIAISNAEGFGLE